jgi:anti-anti-sigma factor
MNNEEILPGFDEEVCDYLTIRLQKMGENALSLEFTGSIDAYNSDYLLNSVKKLIEAGFVRLSFSLSGVNSISSTGVATLVSLHRMVTEKGGDLSMVNMQPKVKTVFSLLHVDRLFRCIDSTEGD